MNVLSNKATKAGLIGGPVLDLVTTGVYGDPRSLYREYLQNSADAFKFCGGFPGRVDITIDPGERCVRIRDNGVGLSVQDAAEELIPLARSKKKRGTDSGFRGIGRLSGLVFADRVSFQTRTSEAHLVTRISWNGTELRSQARNEVVPELAIKKSTTIEETEGAKYPAHFFEVKMSGVARHAAAAILNTEAVRRFVAEVCPVPLGTQFPFSEQVISLLSEFPQTLRTLEVAVNGGDLIIRPYTDGIAFSNSCFDPFSEFETFTIPCADSTNTAAIGWIAHSSYIKAIPQSLGIRGIRAREGNIQIGDEYTFDHLFVEARFNRWCVGEVHIIDTRIVPNLMRNYFEPSPHVRNMENHVATLARAISKRCRMASTMRNRDKRQLASLLHWEDALDLAESGYLARKDAEKLVHNTLYEIRVFQKEGGKECTLSSEAVSQLSVLDSRLNSFTMPDDQSIVHDLNGNELQVFQSICSALVVTLPSPRLAKEVIEAALAARKCISTLL